MKTVTVREAQHQLKSVLSWVESGQAVEITRHGRVVAILRPAPASTAKSKTRWQQRLSDLKKRSPKPLPYNLVVKMREEDEDIR